MSFAFGVPSGDGPPSENPGGPPKDDKTQYAELMEKFVTLNIKFKEVRVVNENLTLQLTQTQNLLGDMTAPTIFNQLQVITLCKF